MNRSAMKRGRRLQRKQVLKANPPRRRESRRFPGATGWTQRVFALYGRVCVACPRKHAQPAVQAHHVVPRHAILTAPHLSVEERRALAYDARNGLPVCVRCHERHTSAVERILRARLPASVIEWACEHGFEHVIERSYR